MPTLAATPSTAPPTATSTCKTIALLYKLHIVKVAKPYPVLLVGTILMCLFAYVQSRIQRPL
jgi:hypothetical protein